MALVSGQFARPKNLSPYSISNLDMHSAYDSCYVLLTLQQSPGPFKARITEPPSNVILDDRAVYDILQSNIPRAQLPKRWSHDFSGQASVRHRRAHRGRPAYKDENATSDNDRYHSFKPTARAAPPYFLSGEKDYESVFYHDLPAAPTESPEYDDEDDSPVKPKQHNQYTAPHLLVRNGAESASLTKGKYRPRVNTFLRRSPSPPWVKDRKRLFGGVGIGRTGASNSGNSPSFDFSFAPAPAVTGAPTGGDSMWVEQDEENEAEEVEDDDEVISSVFNNTTPAEGDAAALGNEGTTQSHGTPSSTRKRPAPSDLIVSRLKVPRRMGYIERLAAGILREEDEEAAASPPVVAAGGTSTNNDDVVAQLEDDLDAANATISEKDEEIAELKSEVEELRTQLALRRSVDDE